MEEYADHVGSRLLEFFGDTTPWPRRLWDAGSIFTLREAHDAAEWVDRGVLSPGALKWLAGDAEKLLGKDPAMGGSALRRQLRQTLRSALRPGNRHQRMLAEITDLVETGYLGRWLTVLESERPPAPERLARAIAAHLLDRGYAMRHLHRWVHGLISRSASLGELLLEGDSRAGKPKSTHEVVVPFLAVPRSSEQAEHLAAWLSASEITTWLREHGGAPVGVRQNGGFRFRIDALDPYTAAASASLIVERMVARSAYARTRHGLLEPLGEVWVRGAGIRTKLRTTHRGAVVRALESERRLYDVQQSTAIDEALELAAPLNLGAPGPAVSGAWAAIEALLVSPRDEVDKQGRGAAAADRLASLVAASWPRAELTTLSHRHHPVTTDRLTLELRGVEANRERARLVANALVRGDSLTLTNAADDAAASRMTGMLKDPKETLGVVQRHVTAAIRRLYRQRNIIVHGGATESLARDVTLRTAAPLVGAGLDRLVHAAFADGEEPLDIAERAQLGLALLGTDDAPHVVHLLTPTSPRPCDG